MTQLYWTILAVSLIVAATVALCLGHLSGTQWVAVCGASGVLGGAGVHLSGGT